MSSDTEGLTLALIIRIPPHGIVQFQAYEAKVLPLLQMHGGQLQRRLRNADGTVEIHIVHFLNRDDFESVRNDLRRAAAAPLLTASGATSELIEVEDVD